jgi:DNA-binding GntR family transcriptional regulator
MDGHIKTLKEVSLADQAFEMIRSAILDSVLKPSERFTIEDMASRLGISRTPVREALKALQGDGMVRLLPHRGAMVERYAHDEIRNRFVIAAMLEGYAAELACQAQPDDIAKKLATNCDTLEQRCKTVNPESAEELRELIELNGEFHMLIRRASGSQTLLRLLASLRQPTAYSINYWKDGDARAASVAIHRKIAAAFLKRDAIYARALVEKHLMDAYNRILRQFCETGESPPPMDEGTDSPQTRPKRRRYNVATGADD